jgi:hypothetical protein
MLRPIRVAPLSQTQLISQNPLVPNNMTQEEVLRNAMATPGSAPLTPNMTARPLISPAQAPAPTATDLGAIGQAGLQQAERVSKRVTQSPGVQGLLGGGQSAAGLLGDIQGQADLQGLFATLQAMGRPVQRGESRLLGAIEYGQQARQQARERGLQDLSTQMRLEEMQRARQAEQRREQIMQDVLRGQSPQAEGEQAQQVDITAGGMFTPFEAEQMTEGQRTAAMEAVASQALSDRFAQADMPEEAKQYAEMAQRQAENARRNLLTTEKRIDLENQQRQRFMDKEYRPRADAVSAYNQIAGLYERGAGLADYANLIAFIKTLDPTSVVREGEVALAGEFQTLRNRVETIYNKAVDGGFTEEFRRDLVETARRAAEIAAQSYDDAVEAQVPIVERQNLRPEQVIVRTSLELTPLPFVTGGSETGGSGASTVRKIRSRGGVPQ